MNIEYWLNGRLMKDDIEPDIPLTEYLRSKGCYSVKRGCETSNCGLCTVLVDEKPVLSCTYPTPRINKKHITTLEGLTEEAKEFAGFMADQGADQCGFCNPGFMMNVLAMTKELDDPDEDEIKEFLSGNLCRCTGYVSQLRAVKAFLKYKKERKIEER